MAFDFKEYSSAIDSFLLQMETVPDVTHPNVQKALNKICSLLRIAQIKLVFYETSLDERNNNGQTIIIYENDEPSESNHYQHREVTGTGNVIIYTISPKRHDTPWNDEEFEKLRVLLKTLFVFHGRIRITQLAEYLTFHDKELKIHNVNYLIKQMNKLIARGCIDEYDACFFNLKHFSAINKQVGRDQGTQIMLAFINTISKDFTEDETICRIGGDNFAMIFLKKNLDYVMNCLKGTEITSDGPVPAKVTVSATGGYYKIPRTCTSSTEIMDCISAASNIARNHSKESFTFYDDQLKQRIQESKIIQGLFPVALENEEFLVYYQPKYNIQNDTIVGAEALCRWYHDGTLILPGRFIPIIEQTREICALDFYMLEHVCRDLRNWLNSGKPVVRVSVNFSRSHFENDDLLQTIPAIIDKYNIPHDLIEVELTETTTDVNFRDLRRIVYGLKAQGIITAIDDFGSGYSSLNLVRDLPWDVIKVDKSFWELNSDNPHNNVIMLKHLISMIQELGKECIVEGVETTSQANLLKECNCFLVQGFLYDKPLTKDVFENRLAEKHA